MSPKINPYGEKLAEFSDFAFDKAEAGTNKEKWRQYFTARMGRAPSRVVFEIGCSNAAFLIAIAKANPDIAFIGADWKFKVLYKGATQIAKEGLKNVALLRTPVEPIEGLFAAGELDEVWLFFPDPWAKKSQVKNRLMQDRFLLPIHERMTKGGKFYFKTDHPGYFQWTCALFGLPEPKIAKQEFAETGEQSYKLKQMKMRKTEDELPATSAVLLKHFKPSATSVPDAALFAKHLTLFEKNFVRDGIPIYFLELFRL